MFGDIFTTEEELLSGETGGMVMNSWERLARNCADKLPLPELPRKKGYPIGLKNQGATCYLNSLFQLLFGTPELREIILQLPLCKQNSQTPSDFVSKGKQSFLLGLQRLFSEMSLCDQRAVGSEYLQKAFGWTEEHHQQHDIQEAMRVIFDTLQRALCDTDYRNNIRSLFRGTSIRYKTCTICGETSQHSEQFFDLNLQVNNLKSVQQSLLALTTPESMDGENAIFCDTCQCKQDMLLGTRLQELPGTFVLSFNRFTFDFEAMDRVKLNSYFQFQLELDMSGYVAPTPDPDYNKYQLYGVVIHRGSAHGGHYICFARDLLRQSDWENGLAETKAEQAKIKERSAEVVGQKVEKTEKQKQREKQNKEYDLLQPSNKKLLEGWFEINDNVATAISANKITTKFEGSDSAYILFYRRKSLPVSQGKVVVPAYFAEKILEVNKTMEQQRVSYQFEKQHVVLNIEGQDNKLKNTLKINQFQELFIPEGTALVLESSHNGMPYYPLQICNNPDFPYKPEDTLFSLEVPHQSVWKRYVMNSPEYEQIRGAIGKDRLPMQIVLVIDGEAPKRIVAYSDQNFLMLRLKIEKLIKLSYENQIITLVTQYKQQVLTDNPQNDQMLLPKLGIIHGGQLQIKSHGAEDDQTKQQQKDQGLLICFVIERDDVIGMKRFYFQKGKTLEELLQYFFTLEKIEDNKKRRFRNLNGNRLFYTDHYPKTLEELQLDSQMVRLRLERGDIPIKGDVSVKIKMQSTLFKKEGEEEVVNIEKIFDPNTVIREVKEWACQFYRLDVSLHKLYLTDWMGEPVRSLTREQLTVFEANFGREETICLRDIYSPIGAELVYLQVFNTTTGTPDSVQREGIHVKIQQFKTVKDLKELLIDTLQLKEVCIDRLRLREMKRDYMFGSIWRDLSKSVKAMTINSTKLVYQILFQPEMLTEEQIVVTLKARNKQKRLYEGATELVFQAGKTPSIEELTEAIKVRLQIKEEIFVAKYFHYNFEWNELSRKAIEDLARQKKKPEQKKKGQQKGKKEEGKKAETSQQQQGQKKEMKEQTKKKNKKQAQEIKKEAQIVIQQEKTSNQGNKQPEAKKSQPAKPQKKDNKEQKPKKDKKGGKGGENHHKQLIEECQNLRKAPVLLKDGDILGWGLASELPGDDLQTEEDLVWRAQVKKETAKYKPKEMVGFKVHVDF